MNNSLIVTRKILEAIAEYQGHSPSAGAVAEIGSLEDIIQQIIEEYCLKKYNIKLDN